ncbi:hypothetical protein WJX73_005344 [Symbiochloris irregularis]|uniref:Metallo-beta-lactamase domain-containing protein n=1 Tax=Symbiochloris irregularis TaxID=706552 RepID=A0AAW1P0P1_9CHLO
MRCQAASDAGSKSKQKMRTKTFHRSDGQEHLGSALSPYRHKTFPGPPPNDGPPIRVLPIGGLGEIGMNCMLVGVYDRYILIDAGLMFPDQADLGMQKILPDTTFLAKWKDKIEALIITHGHEDHIGALPWVFPALDPNTPVYAGGYPMQLIQRRLQEFSLWQPNRFHTFSMNQRFQLGPFECQPVRVTHSIPDCCGLILRSEHGNIVHTGDWKIEENPIDGQQFNRSAFEDIGKDGATLFMSDSTNVLSPGRTTSEAEVQKSLANHVARHHGKGRVIVTQFASNLDRLASVKKAADAAGRKVCFMGLSLHSYLEAAHKQGRAPFNPDDIVPITDVADMDPNKLVIVTTGSQAEPRAQLALAATESSQNLKLNRSDLLLYSARVIPGNSVRVTQMMNAIAAQGPQIRNGRSDLLHTSGHAYRDELEELLRLVKPQHFLPVHGEFSFLCAHAELARENGIHNTNVVRNGQMVGCSPGRNGKSVGNLQLLGNANLRLLYNDGNNGTGTADEVAMGDRQTIASEGIVIAAVEVYRPGVARRDGQAGPASPDGRDDGQDDSHSEDDREVGDEEADDAGSPSSSGKPEPSAATVAGAGRLRCRVRVTTRAMWVDRGRLLQDLHTAANTAVARLPGDATLLAVERLVAQSLRRECRAFNQRKPEVIVIAHEHDATSRAAAEARNDDPFPDGQQGGQRGGQRSRSPSQRGSNSYQGGGRGSNWGGGGRGQPKSRGQPGGGKSRSSSPNKAASSGRAKQAASPELRAPPVKEMSAAEMEAIRRSNPRESPEQRSPDELDYA